MKAKITVTIMVPLAACVGVMGFVPPSPPLQLAQGGSATAAIAANKKKTIAPTGIATLHPLASRTRRSSKSTTSLRMAEQDFDQTQYTDAAWSTIAALPACSDFYSATSVDAPMLLAILLNPTKYQAGEAAGTARQVTIKLLEDAGADIDKLTKEVESFLEKQPKVSGDTSDQKSLGRTLAESLEAGRGVRDGLKVSYILFAYDVCRWICLGVEESRERESRKGRRLRKEISAIHICKFSLQLALTQNCLCISYTRIKYTTNAINNNKQTNTIPKTPIKGLVHLH